MNFNELVAQLDPNYIRKMNHFRESMYAQAEIERFRAGEAMNRDYFNADREDSRLNKKLSHEEQMSHKKHGFDMEREQFIANKNMSVENLRADREDSRQERKFDHDVKIQDKKTSAEMQKEQFKASEAMNREQFKAEREDNRLSRQFDHQKEMEKSKLFGALETERVKGENSLRLAQFDRQTMFEKMELDLRNSILKSGFDLSISTIQNIMGEDTAKRTSLTKQFEERSRLRGDVFKMLAGAIIQEKLAQKQHQRDLEKMEKQSILQRTEQYLESFCAYLIQVNKEQGERATKSEIDRVIGEWEAMG